MSASNPIDLNNRFQNDEDNLPPASIGVVGADESGSAVEAPAVLGLKEIIAKHMGKPMWMPVAILFLALVVVVYTARATGTATAGLSIGKLISIELILTNSLLQQ